jgi:dUTP pyrophosphatase
LYATEDAVLEPGVATLISTGITAVFERPNTSLKFGLLIRDRSSMAKKGIMASAGVVDAGYRGEVKVMLTNMNQWTKGIVIDHVRISLDSQEKTPVMYDPNLYIKKGDKIAQMIPIPVRTQYGVTEVAELPAGKRGENGFGSSGK